MEVEDLSIQQFFYFHVARTAWKAVPRWSGINVARVSNPCGRREKFVAPSFAERNSLSFY
jgi:hypothetical protein